MLSKGYAEKTAYGVICSLVSFVYPCSKSTQNSNPPADSMGYAFTFPLVRLIAGSQIAIGSYTHYPTVSADMVKRVKARTVGVENGGAAKSWARTKIKLL